MNNDHEDLINRIYKNFQTTMIGSLARFEEKFGFLWLNHHKDQERFEDLWEDTRNSILNNGNKQARNALEDIGNYLNKNKVKQRYHYKFFFNDNNNRNNGE